MRVLLDINVVLDLILARKPFDRYAKEIFLMIENSLINGYISAHAITTIHYLVSKSTTIGNADEVVTMLLEILEVVPIDKKILQKATINNSGDYEDAVTYICAEEYNIDMIITRDANGFKKSKIPVISPDVFVARQNM